MLAYWFDWFIETEDKPGRLQNLIEWVELQKDPGTYNVIFMPLDWTATISRGIFATRQEYLATLRTLCLSVGEIRLASAMQDMDVQIIRLVRTLDDLSQSISRLIEMLMDWYSTCDPLFSRKDHISREHALLEQLKNYPDKEFLSLVEETERLLKLRSTLSHRIALMAEERYPNCSALAGGLVAIRLIARAGNLAALARMTSGTIQVLGAENALFSHLHAGTPSPKHGIIYQHRRVHAAPRKVRGRVARVLASRLVLAARLDYYRGVIAPDFVKESQRRVDRAGEST